MTTQQPTPKQLIAQAERHRLVTLAESYAASAARMEELGYQAAADGAWGTWSDLVNRIAQMDGN